MRSSKNTFVISLLYILSALHQIKLLVIILSCIWNIFTMHSWEKYSIGALILISPNYDGLIDVLECLINFSHMLASEIQWTSVYVHYYWKILGTFFFVDSESHKFLSLLFIRFFFRITKINFLPAHTGTSVVWRV
jgi:hypothetical protein